MSFLLAHGVGLFLSVAAISWQASVLVLLVLAVQLFLGRKLPQRWRHALWLLVLARLVLPVLPESPFSIYQVATPSVRMLSLSNAADSREPAIRSASNSVSPDVDSRTHEDLSRWIVLGVRLAAGTWLLGMIALMLVMFGTNSRFVRRLRLEQRPVVPEILQLARSCAAELGVRRSFAVVETRLVSSPAILGLLHPKLLLPVDLTGRLSAEELRLVFLHELAHLRRADLYHDAVLSLLQIVHWFNPILWLAFARMRYDREIATDALVLSGARASLKTQYGHTLIKLIEGAQKHTLPVPAVGILEDPERLKDRLMRIKRATPGGYRWSMPVLALLCVLGALCLTRAYGDAKTIVYQAKVPEQPWNGWGFSSPTDVTPTPASQPEEFSLTEGQTPAPRVFSGKVVVQGPMVGVEVGLISLVGVHWVNPDTYQWQAVGADGTFSLTDARFLDASKALVVRGPNTPWTFLRYNFGPQQSADHIVLRGDVPRKITLSVSGDNEQDLSQSSFELFPAHAQYDDQGHTLRRQRLGEFESGDKKSVEIVAPSGEVAVFAHHDGYASYYKVIDTRKAEHFRFVLSTPGRMKIFVLDRQGNPKSGVRVNWLNPAAPLSLSGTSTDAQGLIVQDNLSPGTFELNAQGFASREIKVEENKTTEVHFRDGINP